MTVRRPVVIGWVLLAVGGWAATLWLGEPAATTGPAPASGPPAAGPEPGPQPEGGSCPTPSAAPSPSAVADPPLLTKVPGVGAGHLQVDCVYLTARDSARAR
ncbi:hypothetical protein [Streptomyces sp. NPDC014623]|uniref:hypothetical protein n=1 Tax=Streptomyces sp. NPDC014623 TaxID=3364875 RepID=UPI0036FCCFD1